MLNIIKEDYIEKSIKELLGNIFNHDKRKSVKKRYEKKYGKEYVKIFQKQLFMI